MKIFKLKNKFPSDLKIEDLLEERENLFNAIHNEGVKEYLNYSAIVSRFNIVCNELRKRGFIWFQKILIDKK